MGLISGTAHSPLHFPCYNKIAADQNDIRAGPCHDLRGENTGFADKQRQQDGSYRTHDKLRYAGDHGQYGVAHALYGGPGYMKNVEHRQADTHNRQIIVGDLQCLVKFFRAARDKAA